jgi:signal transduction histidine kinase/CheY-like chemotaxis protein
VAIELSKKVDRNSGTLRCERVRSDSDEPTHPQWQAFRERDATASNAQNSLVSSRVVTASGATLDEPQLSIRPRHALGWLEGIPLPAALVTPTGEIAAASPALLRTVDSRGKMIGFSLLSLLSSDCRETAAALIAHPSTSDFEASDAVRVTIENGATRFLLRVGLPLGSGRSAMRLVVLEPLNEDDSFPEPRKSSSRGSIPVPKANTGSPLYALAGLPVTALIIADNRVAAVTQRAASLLGLPAKSFEGMPLEDLVGKSAVAELFPDGSIDTLKWQPQALPAVPIRIDGAIRACACCLLPFGRPGVGLLLIEGWGGTTVELSQEQSKHSSSSYLIAGVAHEINNPLSFVLPCLNELKSEMTSRRESARGLPLENWISQLDEILEGVSRIAGVVQNLRAAREATFEAEPTLVNQVIANTLRLATVSVPSTISVRRDLGFVVPARGNRQRLGQVLLNLVLNAAHAIEDECNAHGTIFVRSWSDTRYTWLEVRDDGPGVADEHRDRIFEPFFTTRAAGSGLGLAVCRAMIRELGGELTLEPVYSHGACFRIRLPIWLSNGNASPNALSDITRNTSLTPKKRRVLLVDDDPPVRRALRRMLATHHQVEEAASIQEALEKSQAIEFDVLVTDLVMSHGGGPALIEHLKEQGSHLANHVVVISGMAPDSTPLSFPRITKPCTADELLGAIETVAE